MYYYNNLLPLLYPKSFPPIFLQDMLIKVLSTQGYSRFDQANLLLRNGSTTKVSCCIKVLESKDPKFSPLSQYILKIIHVKFQAMQGKFAQSIAQRPKNRLCQGKRQLWPICSQTSRFLVKINILKLLSSFDQGFIIISQGMPHIHQNPKVAKLGFLRKSQPNFDEA